MIYKEICINPKKNYIHRDNKCITVDEIPLYVERNQRPGVEVYVSYYDFDFDLKQHLEKEKTMHGFNGNYSLTEIVLDFDNLWKTDKELKNQVNTEINGLTANYNIKLEDIKIWFSGRGFHLHIPNVFNLETSKILPRLASAKLSRMFKNCDSIYEYYGLIRVGNTWNRKSGLYKIPLSYDEFKAMSMDEIRELAKKPRS
jgi:hypothetical protein